MQSAPRTDAAVTAAITVSMPPDPYLQRLRALAAWWCLGSSTLAPAVLMRYAPAPLSGIREAGL